MKNWWKLYLRNWMMKIWHRKSRNVNFQTTGDLAGTSPFKIRGQSKVHQNRGDIKIKSTKIA